MPAGGALAEPFDTPDKPLIVHVRPLTPQCYRTVRPLITFARPEGAFKGFLQRFQTVMEAKQLLPEADRGLPDFGLDAVFSPALADISKGDLTGASGDDYLTAGRQIIAVHRRGATDPFPPRIRLSVVKSDELFIHADVYYLRVPEPGGARRIEFHVFQNTATGERFVSAENSFTKPLVTGDNPRERAGTLTVRKENCSDEIWEKWKNGAKTEIWQKK